MPELAPKKKTLDLAAAKPKADAKKPADGTKPNPLKGMSLDEQQALLKPSRATEQDPNAKKAPPPPGESPYQQVLAILAQQRLPACLVPRNIESFSHNSAGQLTLNLSAGFTKEVTDDKGKTHQVKFEQRILMTAWQGRLTSIQGVTVPTSSGARLTDIEVTANGYLRLTGKLGIFSKSLDIKESDFPALP